MNTKKRFEESKKYYLKYINSDIYKHEKITYDAKCQQDYDEFIKSKPELLNRTDTYEDYCVTQITIGDILSNDGITKLLHKLYSLPVKRYSKDIFYKKPTLFKKYDYVHLLYSHSFHGKFAEVKFNDDKYIDSVSITWAQINSFYAVLEYNFSLKKCLSQHDCTQFVCDNLDLLNSKDLLFYYNIDKEEKVDIHTIEEMDNDYFELIFQHYITSLFYSEQGHTTKLISMVHMTRKEPININTLNLDYLGINYYNQKENYVITDSIHSNYYLLAGNNRIPNFSLTYYISKYGNTFYYMFFGYKELKELETNFSKYSTGRKKIKYDKSYIALLNKAQSLLDTRRTSKADIFKAFNKDWELYYGCEKKNFNKEMAQSNIDYKEVYSNTFSYLSTLSNINYTKSNRLISIVALVIALLTLILTLLK